MVTGLVSEGNRLRIKHKMHADKFICNKNMQKLLMLTFRHQNKIPVYPKNHDGTV